MVHQCACSPALNCSECTTASCGHTPRRGRSPHMHPCLSIKNSVNCCWWLTQHSTQQSAHAVIAYCLFPHLVAVSTVAAGDRPAPLRAALTEAPGPGQP
jgi:hypothetical protein